MATVTLDGGQSSSAIGGQTIDYITKLVLQEVHGAPDGLVRSKLQLTLRDFYTRSTGWREVVGPYVVTLGIDELPLNPVDQNSSVQFVHAAYLVGVDAPGQKTPLSVSTRFIQGPDRSDPRAFFMLTPSTMQLYPVPNRTLGRVLYAYCTLIPTAGAIILPDISFTHHLDALMAGTFDRLYSMPKKPWSNAELAKKYGNTYRRELLVWRDFANRGNGSADTPFRFPSFANSPGQQTMGGGTQAGP